MFVIEDVVLNIPSHQPLLTLFVYFYGVYLMRADSHYRFVLVSVYLLLLYLVI